MKSVKKQKLNPFDIMSAQLAVLTDCVPKNCDAIFVHVVPIDSDLLKNNHISVIINAFKKNKIGKIILNPLSRSVCKKNNFEYTGHEELREKLIKCGIPENKIKSIEPSFHTASETTNFLKLAKKENWNKLIISSQPHHQLRCFLQIISVMKEISFYPKVYNLSHYEVPWNQVVKRYISLGRETFHGKFQDHIKSEYDRIIKYSEDPKKGDNFKKHATIDDLLSYMDKRDKIK